MKKFVMALALVSLFLVAGCGGESDSADADAAKASADAEVAVHDCDGGCGMTKVPAEKMTEVDGKFYCAGCAKKAKEDHSGHDHS